MVTFAGQTFEVVTLEHKRISIMNESRMYHRALVVFLILVVVSFSRLYLREKRGCDMEETCELVLKGVEKISDGKKLDLGFCLCSSFSLPCAALLWALLALLQFALHCRRNCCKTPSKAGSHVHANAKDKRGAKN